jgi:hypothetical protein
MNTETAANPAGEADTQTVDTTASAEASTEATAPAGGSTDTSAANDGADDFSIVDDLLPPEDDLEEIDYEGVKAKVPKPLKDAFLRQQDYTRKTMEIADRARLLETAERQLQQAQTYTQAEQQAAFQIHSLNTEIAALEALDWANLDGSDPDVQQASWKLQQDTLKRDKLQSHLNEHLTIKQTRAAQAAQQQAAKERADVDAAMVKKIKDWGPEKRSQLEAFAVEQGIPAEHAKEAGAAEFNLLRLAKIGAQAEAQRRAALAAAIKPANEVGGVGGGSSDPEGMTMAQYKAWRSKQAD